VIPHLLVPGATYLTGLPRQEVLPGLDSSFAGMGMLGFHAMKGTPDGVLNHTQSSQSENRYWYNGVESGELVQSAAIAGYFGVPVIMVTGDDNSQQARRHFSQQLCYSCRERDGRVTIGILSKRTVKPLWDQRAVAAILKCKPYVLDLPIKVKVQYLETDLIIRKLVTREGTVKMLHIL
jgi:D-amino peptidase